METRKKSITKDAKVIEKKDIPEEILSYIKEMEYDWCNDMIKHQWKKSTLLDTWLKDQGIKENELTIFDLTHDPEEL